MAREERELQGREQGELAQLKDAVAALRRGVAAAACGTCQREACVCAQAASDRAAVQRLREERAALLASGVYAAGDPVVASLEVRIAQLAPA